MNHGPDEKGPEGLGQGPEGLRSGLGAGFGPGADGPGALDGLDADELALRRLLHSAVDDVAPRDGALDHLRRAVPARRARKRQAVVGMAAAALFIGTAVPALVHVSNSGGTDPNTSMAGQASQAQGGATGGKNPDGGASTEGGTSGQATGQSPGGAKDGGKSESTGAVTGTKVVPTASAASSAPVCTSEQLGTPTAGVDPAHSPGLVKGPIPIRHQRAAGCDLGGPRARAPPPTPPPPPPPPPGPAAPPPTRRASSTAPSASSTSRRRAVPSAAPAAWPCSHRARPTAPRSTPPGTPPATRRPGCPTPPPNSPA
ncbi:hypothetical protein ACFV23_47375 [Streptomyces sp. NPDC059627]